MIIGYFGVLLERLVLVRRGIFFLKYENSGKNIWGCELVYKFMGRMVRILEFIVYESRGNLRVLWCVLSKVDKVWKIDLRNNRIE